MPYLTPPTTPSATVRRCLCIPDHPVWLAAVSGALLELTRAYNWEDLDGITAEQAASRSIEMFEQYASGVCDMIGEIKAFVGLGAVPSNCLVMDGTTYAQVDYPQLYDLVPPGWKSGTDFILPIMGSTTLIGANTVSPGSPPIVGHLGGEENHVLTVAEIPSHTHQTKSIGSFTGVPNVFDSHDAGSGGFFQSLGNTQNTGGGGAHNNMPPYLAVIWAIVAK